MFSFDGNTEKQVIGAFLLDSSTLKLLPRLSEEDFANPQTQVVFRAIQGL